MVVIWGGHTGKCNSDRVLVRLPLTACLMLGFTCWGIAFLAGIALHLGTLIPTEQPFVTSLTCEILKEMSGSHASKKLRCEGEDGVLLKQVSNWTVTQETLREKLAVDYEMALEYAMQSGVSEKPREELHVAPLDAKFTEFCSPDFVFRLIH